MSSFSLLRLPLVALRNVTECWNPLELYQFSKVSEKTKKAAKSLIKIPQRVEICYGLGNFIRIIYHNKYKGEYSYMFQIGDVDPVLHSELKRSGLTYTNFWIPSDNPSTESAIIFEEILEIFKSSISLITLLSLKGTHDEFKDFILWINSLKQEVNSLVFPGASDLQTLRVFLKNFRKETNEVVIERELFDPRTFNNEPLEFSGVEFESITINNANWFGLQEILTIDFVQAFLTSTRITSVMIKTFLKSWSEGKTNERMENCIFYKLNNISMRTILKEVSIVKGQEIFDYDQVDGNVIIQGHNGKIAVLEFNKDNGRFCITVS